MFLVNRRTYPVYWRTFNPDDTVYIVGLHDGILKQNGVVRLREKTSTGQFQLELKREHLFGELLQSASRGDLYGMDGAITVIQPGVVITSRPQVVLDPSAVVNTTCQALYRQLGELQAQLSEGVNKPTLLKQIDKLQAQIDAAGCS